MRIEVKTNEPQSPIFTGDQIVGRSGIYICTSQGDEGVIVFSNGSDLLLLLKASTHCGITNAKNGGWDKKSMKYKEYDKPIEMVINPSQAGSGWNQIQ